MEKRPRSPLPIADNAAFDGFKAQGQQFLKAMNTPSKSSGMFEGEEWTDVLLRWSYQRIDKSGVSGSTENIRDGMGRAYKALGVSTDVEDWNTYHYIHMEKPKDRRRYQYGGYEYLANNKSYRTTGAEFVIPMNIKHGIIVLTRTDNPARAGKTVKPPIEPKELPELQKTSDFMWGQWHTQAGANVKNIKYIVRWSISNAQTEGAISRALRNANKTLENWDNRCFFPMDSKEGKALLGAPSGHAVAYFLTDHQSQLGDIVVTGVSVFKHDEGLTGAMAPGPVLLFHLGKSSSTSRLVSSLGSLLAGKKPKEV